MTQATTESTLRSDLLAALDAWWAAAAAAAKAGTLSADDVSALAERLETTFDAAYTLEWDMDLRRIATVPRCDHTS